VSKSVLDASAILTILQDEPGSATIVEHLPDAVVSAVNLSEVVAKLAEAGMPDESIRAALTPLALDVCPFDEEAAYLCGTLRPKTKALGLSFGDRACLALGLALSSPVVTTEQACKSLKLGVKVVVVR
jgi:PIN domain nuclease of toxin-antitoxin system